MSKRRRDDTEELRDGMPDPEPGKKGKSGKRSPLPSDASEDGDGLSEDASEDGAGESEGGAETDPWDQDVEVDEDEAGWFSGDMVYGRGPGDDSEDEIPGFEEDDFDDDFDDDFEAGLDEEYDEDLLAIFGLSEDGEELSGECSIDSVQPGSSEVPADEPPFSK